MTGLSSTSPRQTHYIVGLSVGVGTELNLLVPTCLCVCVNPYKMCTFTLSHYVTTVWLDLCLLYGGCSLSLLNVCGDMIPVN